MRARVRTKVHAWNSNMASSFLFCCLAAAGLANGLEKAIRFTNQSHKDKQVAYKTDSNVDVHDFFFHDRRSTRALNIQTIDGIFSRKCSPSHLSLYPTH